MFTYEVFYNRKSVTLQASDLYAAKQKGIAHFKPAKSKQHMVTPVLVVKGDEQVTHSTASV